MSFRDFRKSLMFIKPIIDNMHGSNVSDKTISIHYIGGEIILVPNKELEKMVLFARQLFSDYKNVIDGVQSNLIAGAGKLDHLVKLFGHRIGTSEEFIGKSRTIKGSSELYQSVYKKSELHLAKKGVKAGVIYAVSKDSAYDVLLTYKKCSCNGQNFGLRPVFNGGMKHDKASDISHLSNVYNKILDSWFMSGSVIVEPFYGFTKRMLDTKTSCTGCPFQSNCTERSLDIEANGDIFICMDMADSRQYKLGNALRSEFNTDILKRLSKRKKAILEECGDCEFYMSCKGGCMSEAIHTYDSFTKKTPYCSLWKEIHAKIKHLICEYGTNNVREWMRSL